MIKLEDYGYCLEEYNYDIINGVVKEISYTLHNEKNQDVAVIGVYNQNGKYRRSLVLWPHTNPKGIDKGYLNDTVDEMKLYLDTTDVEFDFKNVTVYTYASAKNKFKDEFEITVKGTKGTDVSIFVDKNNAAVYDSSLKIFKVYHKFKNGKINYNLQIEKIRLTDFGVITESHNGNIYVLSNNGKVRLYTFHKVENLIDLLETRCNSVRDCDEKLYDVDYDKDGLVETVSRLNELYSRNEREELISISQGKVGEIVDSIYPTLITDNFVNYQYPFMRLWTHDKIKKDRNGNIEYFERKIYVIRKPEKIINKLRENLTKLSINY